jgi:hypothetical protein
MVTVMGVVTSSWPGATAQSLLASLAEAESKETNRAIARIATRLARRASFFILLPPLLFVSLARHKDTENKKVDLM